MKKTGYAPTNQQLLAFTEQTFLSGGLEWVLEILSNPPRTSIIAFMFDKQVFEGNPGHNKTSRIAPQSNLLITLFIFDLQPRIP